MPGTVPHVPQVTLTFPIELGFPSVDVETEHSTAMEWAHSHTGVPKRWSSDLNCLRRRVLSVVLVKATLLLMGQGQCVGWGKEACVCAFTLVRVGSISPLG